MEASISRLRHQDILTLCVFALLGFGVVMVQSASTTVTGDLAWQWSPMGAKHLKFAIAAAITFFAVSRFDYARLAAGSRRLFRKNDAGSEVFRRAGSDASESGPSEYLRTGVESQNLSYTTPSRPFIYSPIAWAMGIAMLACLAVLVPGIGAQINGARRWIKFGPLVLQPSELAKWATVLFLAYWLTRKPTEKFVTGFLPAMIPVGGLCLLVVIQDFGTAALIAVCAFTMLLAGRIKIRHILTVLAALLAGWWFIHHKAYRGARLTAFMHPWDHPQGTGYHMIQSLLSFSTGGLFGRGLGNGIQKLGYLPEDTTDFIFAVICEELGVFGAMLAIALYLGIIFVAWQIIRQKRDDFGRMLAFGIASMIGLQAAINIAVATVSVPTKGLSLPLISAGGSGLVITSAALGLLCSTTRFARRIRGTEEAPEPRGFPVGGVGGVPEIQRPH